MLVSVPFPGGKVSCHVLLDLTYIHSMAFSVFINDSYLDIAFSPVCMDVCVYADSRQSRINREILRSIPPYY
jgi:hypothetical protein